MNKEFLYHGSSCLVDILVPHKATGVGSSDDQQMAIYATSNRDFALLFSIPLKENAEGNYAWEISSVDNKLKMKLLAGKFDDTGKAYLYIVPKEKFIKIDEWQYVCYEAIEPLSYEEIDIKKLKELIINE